jgi:hypothetical protein
MTLLEVMIAMFIFTVGILGCLAALPTGITAASIVILQDAAIHLSHSKFAEFRRDRINPAVELDPNSGSGYLPAGGGYTPGKQEPINATGAPWRDFAHDPSQPYEFFDDIQKYEWSVETSRVNAMKTGNPNPAATFYCPEQIGNPSPDRALQLTRVTITVRLKGHRQQLQFTQYMCAWDPKGKS